MFMITFLLDLLFPKYCLSCNREGEYWCAQCKAKPLKTWDGNLQLIGTKYFDEIICVADYEDETINKLIKACKYRFIKEIANDLGEILYKELQNQNSSGDLVPVPLSARRERWRGFNQAAEITQAIAKKTGLRYSACLKKIKHTKAQAKLSEEARILNLKGCFELCGNAPEQVILIDDVITTGTTVNECARVLKEKGAKYITVVAVAKG